jgi:hypothetical protein
MAFVRSLEPSHRTTYHWKVAERMIHFAWMSAEDEALAEQAFKIAASLRHAQGISITVSRSDRRRLQALVADRNASQKHVWRAEIVLLTADGLLCS